MSFNDNNFMFGNYNFGIDVPFNHNISTGSDRIVPPKGEMVYLSGTPMGYLDGDNMVYLET